VKRRTLNTYLAGEILLSLCLGLLTFTFILLIARILKLIELVVIRGVPLLQIGKLLALILPTFLEMTVPMALLLGIFLGLGRLSSDQEILALKACGISPAQILLPIGIVALAISLITFVMAAWARPAANLALKKELYRIARSYVGTSLKEKVFNDDFPKILVYVDEVEPSGTTSHRIMIVDRRQPARENIIFGKVAHFLSDEESQSLSLRLLDGAIYEREKKRPGFSQTNFQAYDFKLEFEEAFSHSRKKEKGPKEISLSQLQRTIHLKKKQGLKPTAELMELHQRFAFAFAPLIFGLLGVALSLLPTRSRSGRSGGLLRCLFWILIYYGLLSLGKAFGEREWLPPALALWLPNLVLGLSATHFFSRALKESPLLIQTKLEALYLYLHRRFTQ